MNPHSIQTTPHYDPNPNRSRTFTVNFFSKPITTVVTATPAVAQEWIYTIRCKHRNDLYNGSLVIGLGVQWTPTNSSGESPEAATIQLCVDSNCLIFQLSHAESVPATLRELVADVSVTLVGVHNGRDKRVLEGCRHGLEVGARVVDLAADQRRGNASMEELAAEVLGMEGIVKPRWLGFSDWGEFWLSDEQVQYACVDSHVSYLLALEFGYGIHDVGVNTNFVDVMCERCGSWGHIVQSCKSPIEGVNVFQAYKQNNPYSNYLNEGYRNHPNLSYRNNNVQNPQPQQPPPQNYIPPQMNYSQQGVPAPNNEEMFANLQRSYKEQNNAIKRLEAQMLQLTTSHSTRQQGSLQAQPNPPSLQWG